METRRRAMAREVTLLIKCVGRCRLVVLEHGIHWRLQRGTRKEGHRWDPGDGLRQLLGRRRTVNASRRRSLRWLLCPHARLLRWGLEVQSSHTHLLVIPVLASFVVDGRESIDAACSAAYRARAHIAADVSDRAMRRGGRRPRMRGRMSPLLLTLLDWLRYRRSILESVVKARSTSALASRSALWLRGTKRFRI